MKASSLDNDMIEVRGELRNIFDEAFDLGFRRFIGAHAHIKLTTTLVTASIQAPNLDVLVLPYILHVGGFSVHTLPVEKDVRVESAHVRVCWEIWLGMIKF